MNILVVSFSDENRLQCILRNLRKTLAMSFERVYGLMVTVVLER
jgi:hypothetical protein